MELKEHDDNNEECGLQEQSNRSNDDVIVERVCDIVACII
jgi:hypothetical protein